MDTSPVDLSAGMVPDQPQAASSGGVDLSAGMVPDVSPGLVHSSPQGDGAPYSMPDGRVIDPATHTGGMPNPHAVQPTAPPPTQPTVEAAPAPSWMQRARSFVANSTPGEAIHAAAPGLSEWLGIAPTESETAEQERQANAGIYKPVTAIKQIGAGLSNIEQSTGMNDQAAALMRANPGMTQGQAISQVRAKQGGTNWSQAAKGANQVMGGTMEVAKPIMPVAIAAAPVDAAIYYGAGILTGKGTAAVAQEMGATPDEVDFFNTAGFFIPGVLTSLAAVKSQGIPEGATVRDPVTGEQVPVRGGVVAGHGFAAGVARSDTGGYAGQVKVGPYSASVKFGRNAPETAPSGPAAIGEGEAPTPAPQPQPDAAAVQQRAQQATIDEVAGREATIAAKARQIAGIDPPPPPPPQPGEPGSKQAPLPAGMDKGQLSPQVVENAGKAIQHLPPADQPTGVLEATGNLAKWMFSRKTIVGPDGKVVNVDSPKAAQTEAVNIINAEVDRQAQKAQDAQQAKQDAEDAQQKALDQQQKDAETAAQEREDARQEAEKNQPPPPVPDSPQMQVVRAALAKLPGDTPKADVILAARKAAAKAKMLLPFTVANRLADEHIATRAQQETAAAAGLTGEKINPDQDPIALGKLAGDVRAGKSAFLQVADGTKFKPSELTKQNGFISTTVKKAQDPTFNGTYFHPAEIKSKDVKAAASGESPLAALHQLEATWKAGQSPAHEPENQGRAVLSDSSEQTQLGNPEPETKAAEPETKPAVAEAKKTEPEPMDEVQLYREARKAALARGINPETTEAWGTAIAEEEARILAERKSSNQGEKQEVSAESKEVAPKTAGPHDEELRADLGVSRAALDAYDPEKAVRKMGRGWWLADLNGKDLPSPFDTKAAAIKAAEEHKALKESQFENPADYRDIISVRARKHIALAEQYQKQGMSEMEAYAKAHQEIPDIEQKSAESVQSSTANAQPQEKPVETPSPVDWNNDESVVRAALDTKNWTPQNATQWNYQRRTNPTVKAFEEANRPAPDATLLATAKRENPPQVAQPTKMGAVEFNNTNGKGETTPLKGTEYIFPGFEEYHIAIVKPRGSVAAHNKLGWESFEVSTGRRIYAEPHQNSTEQKTIAGTLQQLKAHGKAKLDAAIEQGLKNPTQKSTVTADKEALEKTKAEVIEAQKKFSQDVNTPGTPAYNATHPSPAALKPGQKVTVRQQDGTQRTAEVRFLSPTGKVVLKGERKPVEAKDVSPAEATDVTKTEAQAVAPGTVPPSELEEWKAALAAEKAKGRNGTMKTDQINALRAKILDAEKAVETSKLPLTEPQEKLVTEPDQNKWKYQAEYFVKALEPVKDAWLSDHAASNRDANQNWDFLRKNETYNGEGSAKHRPAAFPDDFIRIEVPHDGKFLVKNTPAAIDKLLKSAPRAFAKPSTTEPGSTKRPVPRAPKEIENEKLIAHHKAQIEETEQDLQRARPEDREHLTETLKAARENLAAAEKEAKQPTESGTVVYSNPLADPALYKKYIGEPLMKMAEPLRMDLAERSRIADQANNIHDQLQNLDRTNRATTLEAKGLVRSMRDAGFSNEDGKEVFRNLEDPAVKLTPKQEELRDNWIKPLNQTTKLQYTITELIKSGKFSLDDILEGKVPEEKIKALVPDQDNYQHRIPVERDTFVDKLLGDSLKRFRAPGNALSRMFPSAKRSVFKEIHGPDGEREVVAVKNGRVTQFINKDNEHILNDQLKDAQAKVAQAKQDSPSDTQRHAELQGDVDDLLQKKADLLKDGHTTVDLGAHLPGYINTSQLADEAVKPLEKKLDGMKKEFSILHGSQKRAIASQQRIENLYYQIDNAEKQVAAIRASVGPKQEAEEGLSRNEAMQERIKPLEDQIARLTEKQGKLAGRETQTRWSARELKNIPGRIQDLKDRIDAIGEEMAGAGLEGNYWRDKNGDVWKFNRGTTEFISERTGQKYHADARLAGIVNYMETNKAMNAAVVLERAKGLLESEGMALKTDNSKDAPDGWKPTSLQQMRGYYFPAHVADAFDQFDYLQQRGAPNVLEMANNFVIQSVLMNPLYHGLNIGSNWFAGKEGEALAGRGIRPSWYVDNVKAGIEAANMMKDWGGPEYQRLLRLGLDLRGADTGFDMRTKEILRSFTDELDGDKESNALMSGLIGVKNAGEFMRRMNHQITFGMGDMALAQSFYAKRAEFIRNGMTTEAAEEAARDWAHRMVGEYTTPIRLAGSAGLGRLAENPLAQSFFRYHFGYILRPLTTAVREAAGEFKPDEDQTYDKGKPTDKFGQSPAQSRALAIARLAALVAMAVYVFPKILDQAAKKLTGDERAQAPRGGQLKFASDAYETLTGERSIASLAGSVFTPGLGSMEAVELGANRDNFTGRHIYGSDQDTAGKAKQVAAWIWKGTLPGQTSARADQSGLRQVVEGLAGFKFPIEHGIKEAVEIRRDEGGSNPPDPERTRIFQSMMAAAEQAHRTFGQDTSLAQALKASGKLSNSEKKTLDEAMKEAPIVFAVRGLEHPQDYYRVLEHSTDIEKSALLHDSETRHKINMWQKELRSEGKTEEADKVLSEMMR